MITLRNGSKAEILGFGLLSKNFIWVEINDGPKFLLFASTKTYRADDKEHEWDIIS